MNIPVDEATWLVAAGMGVPIIIVGIVGYCLAGLPHQSHLPPFSIGFVSVSAPCDDHLECTGFQCILSQNAIHTDDGRAG
jgi:hypothetical protein